jgi:anti-sigma B factor antagonist
MRNGLDEFSQAAEHRHAGESSMSEFAYIEPRPGVLTLSGELTVECARELQTVLLATLAKTAKLEVDLLNVTKLDTAGVQLLLVTAREARASGKQLVWLGYSLAVEEVLELLDLSDLLGRPAAVVWS